MNDCTFKVSYPSGLNEHMWINISLDNNENLYLLVTSSVAHHQISLLVLMICATFLIMCVVLCPLIFLVVGDFNYPNIEWINGC